MQDSIAAAYAGRMVFVYGAMGFIFASGVIWQLAYAGRVAGALSGGAVGVYPWICLSASLGQATCYTLFALWMARAAYRALG